MINLLPKQSLARARRDYYARLAALALFALALSLIASAAFLLPSYLFARIERSAALERSALLQSSPGAAGTAAAAAELAQTNELLSVAAGDGSVTALLTKLLAARPRGIALIRLYYDGSREGSWGVSGTAATRDALLSFRDRLTASGAFGEVELPISNLAKAADVDFSMTIRLKKP